MVALPTPLKAMADSLGVIKYILRLCAFQLYGWICEAEEVQEEAEMIRKGVIPDNYPALWPFAGSGKTPQGMIQFDPQIDRFIERRKQEIRDDLNQADLGNHPHYPKEQVREVLAFWHVKL